MKGDLIQNLPTPREATNPGIESSIAFTEWEAGTAAGLDMHEWESTYTYSRAFKARTIAWYRLHNLVKLHSEVEAHRAAEKRAKKGRRKR